MKWQKSYPLPERNHNYDNKEIFYHNEKTYENKLYWFNKILEKDTLIIANQYLSIEKILIDSFEFVMPIRINLNTCSVKYATVIRESSNLFEIVSRKIYYQFFKMNTGYDINILNYLSLDNFLNFSSEEVFSPTLYTIYGTDEKIEPFKELKDWSRNEKITSKHIPQWWNAYNKIKHDTNYLESYANLKNAIDSLAGVFVLINKIYGNGLLTGKLARPNKEKKETHYYDIPNSRIFLDMTYKTASF